MDCEMNKPISYEASVQYDSEPISLLDRNILRIAKNYGVLMCGDSFEYGPNRQRRRIAYGFETKEKRLKFIAAVKKFLKTSNFGEITVE